MAHKWTDNEGRDWLLAINVANAKQVRDLVAFDLTQILERKDALLELLGDDFRLVDVLYVLHAKQVAERFGAAPDGEDLESYRQRTFAEALAGDAIEAATSAFLGALIDFFPNRRRRLLAAALAKVNQTQEALANRALTKIDSQEMTQAIERVISQADQEMSQAINGIGNAIGGERSNN